MGYIVNQLAARWGPGAALVVTVFLRVPATPTRTRSLAGIVVLFTIFAAWYWRVRKLWPLVFAHMLLDSARLDHQALVRLGNAAPGPSQRALAYRQFCPRTAA